MATILINATAARNNGDVALIMTLRDALVERGHRVYLAAAHRRQLRLVVDEALVCREVLGYQQPLFRRHPLSDLAALALLLFSPTWRRADLIIGAPGGYLNSFYGFEWKLVAYRWAKRFGKRTAIYAQSVGPLNGHDRRRLKRGARDLDVLMVRDSHSQAEARAAGVPGDRLLASVDAIFLRRSRQSHRSVGSDVVGISVREWRHDGRDVTAYANMMFLLACAVLARGMGVEFISTCQGIGGYIDDAALAQTIAKRLRAQLGTDCRVQVTQQWMPLPALRERIASFRAVIGTRLHMCLLALTQGVPAFNISYESKGMECYGYLGMPEWSVDYNAGIDTTSLRVARFLDSLEAIRAVLPSRIERQHRRATRDLETFLGRLGLGAERPECMKRGTSSNKWSS